MRSLAERAIGQYALVASYFADLSVRDLTPAERALLTEMLSVDGLADAAELQRQGKTARAASVPHGGYSIYLITERGIGPVDEEPLPSPIVEGSVLDESGQVIAGLFLFAYHGWLHEIEVYPLGNTPVPLPPVNRTRLRLYVDGA